MTGFNRCSGGSWAASLRRRDARRQPLPAPAPALSAAPIHPLAPSLTSVLALLVAKVPLDDVVQAGDLVVLLVLVLHMRRSAWPCGSRQTLALPQDGIEVHCHVQGKGEGGRQSEELADAPRAFSAKAALAPCTLAQGPTDHPASPSRHPLPTSFHLCIAGRGSVAVPGVPVVTVQRLKRAVQAWAGRELHPEGRSMAGLMKPSTRTENCSGRQWPHPAGRRKGPLALHPDATGHDRLQPCPAEDYCDR